MSTLADRSPLLSRAMRLAYLTIGWNVIEGVVAVAAASAVGSVALLGFGVDSFVESASGGIVVWRLLAERSARDACEVKRLDTRARRLVGASLFLLAAFVLIKAGKALWFEERPEVSSVGIALLVLSMAVMLWLAREKRRVAAALESRALEADAFQTTACWWLSVTALIGIALNGTLGWWWADPVAAIAMTYFIVKEGREAWEGKECGCEAG